MARYFYLCSLHNRRFMDQVRCLPRLDNKGYDAPSDVIKWFQSPSDPQCSFPPHPTPASGANQVTMFRRFLSFFLANMAACKFYIVIINVVALLFGAKSLNNGLARTPPSKIS